MSGLLVASLVLAVLAILTSILGSVIGNGVYYGKIKSTFGLVIDLNDDSGRYDNTLLDIKIATLFSIVLGIFIPGLGGLASSSCIVHYTYPSKCAQNKVAFLHLLSFSPQLQVAFYPELQASGINLNGNWSAETWFNDWWNARCDNEHV
jgi:hypothetical protein